MARYFLDTSALIKRYAASEPGHAWISNMCAPEAANAILVAEIVVVEVIATFCRMARATPPRLNIAERDALFALFRQRDLQGAYAVVTLTRPLLDRAANLCLAHPLRAYDATQLACALQARDDAVAAGVAVPVFVCADVALLAAATAEGLSVDNPNAHS